MSIISHGYMIRVSCDIKDCLQLADGLGETAGEARNKLRIAGWYIQTGKVYCPEHKPTNCKCTCHKEQQA